MAFLRLSTLAASAALLLNCSSLAPAADQGGSAGAPAAGSGDAGAGALGDASGGVSGASVGGGGAVGRGGQAGAGGQGGAGSFTWPDGKTAAVSLTYDDGLDAHLAHAIPLLDQRNIKATFVIASFPGVDHDFALPNATSPLSARHQAWLAAAGRGHEIAGHTVNHPCVTAVNPGQQVGFRLDTDYDLARIEGELDDSLARITRLGATAPFSFAYPCYADLLGVGASTGAMVTVLGKQMPQGQLFTSEVDRRFLAARGSTEGIANPATVDLHSVPHVFAGPRSETDSTPTLAQLTDVVDMAIARRGWVVFVMHGVAGDTLPTSCSNGLTYAPETCVINYLDTKAATHDGLVDYLAGKPEVWTTTFKAVAQDIETKRGG